MTAPLFAQGPCGKMMKGILIWLMIFCCGLCLANSERQGTGDKISKPKENYNADSTWKWGGLVNINFSQVAIGEYWAAGGLSSYSLTSLLRLYASHKKGKLSFDNNFDLGYGIIKQGEINTLSSQQWLKSDDRFELNSKLGYQIKDKKTSITGLLNFKSQIAPGLNPADPSIRTSNFLAPGYLVFGGGIDTKPNKYISVFIAPVSSGKLTIVNDQGLADFGAFGVTPGSKYRLEFGGFLKIIYKRENISENKDSPLYDISFQSNLDLFSNYLNSPQNIDVNWGMAIGLRVNKYISVTITMNLIYDDDVNFLIEDLDASGNVVSSYLAPRTQLKEVMGVGFAYYF